MNDFSAFLPANAATPDLAALALLPLLVLGIHWMRSPRTAVRGNLVGSLGMLGFILFTLAGRGKLASPGAWGWMALGAVAGAVFALRVRMIQMPELVAMFNGIGGAASALVALIALQAADSGGSPMFRGAALMAVAIGTLTFSGSLVAGLKLGRLMPSHPIRFPRHGLQGGILLSAAVLLLVWSARTGGGAARFSGSAMLAITLLLGLLFMLRVGGADMPVSISLLNALSGLAAAVAGFAMSSPVPVAVGALIGAAGLMLTAIMCRAMNRRLADVLSGRSLPSRAPAEDTDPKSEPIPKAPASVEPAEALAGARRVAIVPGYGMALAQAQGAVKRLFDILEKRGATVCFAIHPVAGRMPGHMHILLAEVNIPYDRFLDMEAVNPMFPEMDVALVVGANDVVNPAANHVEGTPISGMPVLRVERARAVIVCNLDRKPGYAGVPNPLFELPNTCLCLGNAAETVARLADSVERGPPRA